jgi:hypothetical protein
MYKTKQICLTLCGIATSVPFNANPANAQIIDPTAVKCTAVSIPDIAGKIAVHGWSRHSAEYASGTVIAGLSMPSSPKITTLAEFKSYVQSVMGGSVNRTNPAGKKYFWGASTGTFVVYNPYAVDCGTAFRPVPGKSYYDTQL